MIIRRIEAENLLKYRRLAITNLPDHGRIALAGPNEAGKTAIGETICFALFGRTFSLPPTEIQKVIHWGEFHGSVSLEFAGADNRLYVVAREMDNNGAHRATLHLVGDANAIAEGAEAVAEAVQDICGFTYTSFIDSFYLAQRELEVPHAKSATVKALIGIDKLESVDAALATEVEEASGSVHELQRKVHEQESRIAEVKLDRAHLGRLESLRDAKREEAVAAEAEAGKLENRAGSIEKAARSFTDSIERFAQTDVKLRYREWRQRKATVSAGVTAAVQSAKGGGVNFDPRSIHETGHVLEAFEQGLAGFDRVKEMARLYRERLSFLLDDHHAEREALLDGVAAAEESDMRFAERRSALFQQIERVRRKRKPMTVSAVIVGELALVCWVGLLIAQFAPGSLVGGWISSLLPVSALAQVVTLAIGAIALTGVTVALAVMVSRAGADIRRLNVAIENVWAAAENAREDLDLIDGLEKAALPDAVKALRGLHNDLVQSAAATFLDGEGAVLVQPQALKAKIQQLREISSEAQGSLADARDRAMDKATRLKRRAAELHESVEALDKDIEVEKARWAKVENLERGVATLKSRVDDLHHQMDVRKLGRELIEKSCRRVYSRFNPELRRFVTRILPKLTQDRYQHLEIDEDLRVRVFCNEKNSFVGLSELSNGTHRQLMLCVRLALSQALIASSGKSSQFIFFDEPFAFFDEQRMASAIDVLHRISPQITQVWLAAQTFQDPNEFDLVIDCNVDSQELIVNNERARASKPTKTIKSNGKKKKAAAPLVTKGEAPLESRK